MAKDIADTLDYAWNGMKTIGHVPEEWRGVESVPTPSGNQAMHVLSEQGVYFFAARSDKPKAVSFQKWIAGEVLPSIRKTGSYSVTREPLTEVDRLASMMTQFLPALSTRLNEVNQEMVELRQQVEAVNPEAITAQWEAIQVKKIELRKQLTAMVRHVVTTAKTIPFSDLRYPVAQGLDHYSKVWTKVHRHVGVARIDDYVTLDHFEKGLAFAQTLRFAA